MMHLLNHRLVKVVHFDLESGVGDTIWLKRFATHPSCQTSLHEVANLPNPGSLNLMLFEYFSALSERRVWLDCHIANWIGELSDGDLNLMLSYHNTKGIPARKWFSSLVHHFFNHQTHHRGQVSALLAQAGEDVDVTDLQALIPNETHV